MNETVETLPDIAELKDRQAKLSARKTELDSEIQQAVKAVSAASAEARQARIDVQLEPSPANKARATKAVNKLDESSTQESRLYEDRDLIETELDDLQAEIQRLTASDLKLKRKSLISVVAQELPEAEEDCHRAYARRLVLLGLSIGASPYTIDPHANSPKVVVKSKIRDAITLELTKLRDKYHLEGVI